MPVRDRGYATCEEIRNIYSLSSSVTSITHELQALDVCARARPFARAHLYPCPCPWPVLRCRLSVPAAWYDGVRIRAAAAGRSRRNQRRWTQMAPAADGLKGAGGGEEPSRLEMMDSNGAGG